MADGTCSLEGCSRVGKITYGWCQGHYRRWKKHGDPGPVEIAARSRITPGQACATAGCDRTGKLNRGLCTAHYARWRVTGDVGSVAIAEKFRYGDQPCRVETCQSTAFCKSLCSKHYQRMLKTGTTDDRARVTPKPCVIQDCHKLQKCRGYCTGHYIRLRKYGDPLGSTPRPEFPTECSVEDCDRKPLAHGLCMKHHSRWRNHGDPTVNLTRVSKAKRGLCSAAYCERPVLEDARCEAHHLRRKAYLDKCAEAMLVENLPLLPAGTSLSDRFYPYVNRTETCWLWTAALSDAGYGLCAVGPRLYRPAHRIGWILAGKERLKPGYHLDHLCRVRSCVNPDHLEQVTPAVNNRRGVGPAGVNFRKTHCNRGHEFDLVNTYFPPSGNRHCRKCISARGRARRLGIPIEEALLLAA
jgi:hypothetical protein